MRLGRGSKTDISASKIGVLSDATKSVSRAYINNFQDKGKQTAIDMFLVNATALKRNDSELTNFPGQLKQSEARQHIRSYT
jgi:hypothetical protein